MMNMRTTPTHITFQSALRQGCYKPNRLHYDESEGLIAYKSPFNPRKRDPKKQNLIEIFKESISFLNADLMSKEAIPIVDDIIIDIGKLKKRYDSRTGSFYWRIRKFILSIFKELSLTKSNYYAENEIATRQAFVDFTQHVIQIKSRISGN